MKSICFVCGSKGANNILHVKPRSKGAFFSFLEGHDPPKGAKLPNGEGVVSACLVCYAFLNQQWDSFERSKTPLVKRLYWLKRVDNRSFTGAELNVQGEYVAQIMGVQYNCGLSGNISPFDYGSHTGISCSVKDAFPSPTNDSSLSSSIDNPPERVCGVLNGVLDLSVSPKKPKAHSRRSQKSEDGTIANASKALGSSGSKLGANGSKSIGCDVLSSAKQKTGSIVCYVCCKTCPPYLARFVYAIKYSDDEPYFPFILGLAEPAGAMALTKNGVTQVCSECRKTLSRQWRIFESRKVPEMDRVYKINDTPIVVEKTTKENGDSGGDTSVATRSGGSACYLCGDIMLLSSMYTLRTRKEEAKDETSCLVLPFIEKLKCPLGARPITSQGMVLVCGLCHEHIRSQWKKFEENNLPPDRREYMLRPFLSANTCPTFPLSVVEKSNSVNCTAAAEKKSQARTQLPRDGETPSDARMESAVEFTKETFPPFLLDLCVSDGRRTVGAFSQTGFRMPFPSPLLLKMDCNKNMTTKGEADRLTCNGFDSSSKESNHPSIDVVHKRCFLCGCKCKKLRTDWKGFVSIHDRPDVPRTSSEDAKTCFVRPFFPFLSGVTPSVGPESTPDEVGRFDVCYVCYHNLVGQWSTFEKSRDLEEQNRWLRKYRFRCFVCSICRQSSERHKVEVVTVEEAPLVLSNFGGLVSIEGVDCGVVCSSCIDGLQLNRCDRSGQKAGKVKRRKSKTVGESSKLERKSDEHQDQTKTASNSSSSSSSSAASLASAAAAAAKDPRPSSFSSSSSTSSSPTQSDVKTTTGSIGLADDGRWRRRKREQRRDEEERALPPPPIPSHHLFPRPAAAAATVAFCSMAGSVPAPPPSSSSSNSYLEALRRMTMESGSSRGPPDPPTKTAPDATSNNFLERSRTGSNGLQGEGNLLSSIKDSSPLMKKKSVVEDGSALRKINSDEVYKKVDQPVLMGCNGLPSSLATKDEEAEDALMTQSSSSSRRGRSSWRTNSSSVKADDIHRQVVASPAPTKKMKSPTRSGAAFSSSPIPLPPSASAAADASVGRLGCNGFIPPPSSSSSSSSDRILNPGPFHPSLVRHPPHPTPPQQLSSSASSFMSPDGLYLPQLIASSSPVFSFLPPPHPPPLPSSTSALRWDEYLMMQKLQQHQQQQMISSSSSSYHHLAYPGIFPPSLIHPLLHPTAISSPFLYAADRSSASISLPSSAFDLSSVLRRDFYRRQEFQDGLESSDAGEMESTGYWKSGVVPGNMNGCRGTEEEEDEEEGRTDATDDVLRMRRDDRLEEQPRDTKPNFHRPFLQDDSEEEEEVLEVERGQPYPPPPGKNFWTHVEKSDTVKSEVDDACSGVSCSDLAMSDLKRSDALIETSRSRLTVTSSVHHPRNGGHLVTTMMQPKPLDGRLAVNGFADVVGNGASHLSKDEILNAALSLISLQSPRLLSSLAKRTTEQRDRMTALDNGSNDNGSHCHRSTNNNEPSSEDTSPCKRLRLDVDHFVASSSQPTSNSRCTARHDTEQKQSLPIHRLLSSPSKRPTPETPPPPTPPPLLRPSTSRSSSSSSPLSHLDDLQQTSSFQLQWPGIEAIIESYQEHCLDYAFERRFLVEQGLQSAHTRRCLLASQDAFQAKILEMTRMQQALDSERNQLQSLLDNLTCCLRQLR